ncbi:MAG: YheU family protein [Deltaproteobacteria bacterium]|nr:YheU family protein [Deltaproteobacteria bacterium]
MQVPWNALPSDVLDRVIEDFVTRGGTDDGQVDVPLERRVALVRAQLRGGEAVLVWDAESESVNIVLRSELPPR